MSKLAVSIVQFNISWKEKQTNFKRIQEMLIGTEAELVVLPELFQTGFCIDDMSVAETMEGPTVSWMCAYSRMHKNAICGSFLCQDSDLVFNRFVLVSEGEIVGHYDKTHLFGLDGEQEYISAGSSKVDMVVKGFKIRPIVCYDLRFAYTSFNDTDYDILLNVANWPSQRIAHWDTMLQARAIENQVFVLGCNRVGGQDGHFYPGHSSAYDPEGLQVVHSLKEEVISITLNKKQIEETRSKLPFLQDRRM